MINGPSLASGGHLGATFLLLTDVKTTLRQRNQESSLVVGLGRIVRHRRGNNLKLYNGDGSIRSSLNGVRREQKSETKNRLTASESALNDRRRVT